MTTPDSTSFSRRSFLRGSAAAAAAGAFAVPAFGIKPIGRAGQPRFPLSLAAYSFRGHFAFMKDKPQKPADPAKPLDMFGFLDFCADLGIAGAELTSYFFKAGAGDDYFLALKRHAFLRGVAISGTAVGNNFAHPEGGQRAREIADVKAWIDRAAVLGAPHIRVFAGQSKEIDAAASRKLCIAALEECCDYAGTKGIFLGVENHGGIVAEADGLLEIIKAVQSKWIGVNLDTGNFHTDDPYGDLAKCAPYAVNVQVKAEIQSRGHQKEAADYKRIAQILRDANYQGYVALEYEAAGDPWKAVPDELAKLRDALGA